jgi:hypothetical protein
VCGSSHVGHMRNKILVGRPEEKRQLGIPKRDFEDNIRMDLKLGGRL